MRDDNLDEADGDLRVQYAFAFDYALGACIGDSATNFVVARRTEDAGIFVRAEVLPPQGDAPGLTSVYERIRGALMAHYLVQREEGWLMPIVSKNQLRENTKGKSVYLLVEGRSGCCAAKISQIAALDLFDQAGWTGNDISEGSGGDVYRTHMSCAVIGDRAYLSLLRIAELIGDVDAEMDVHRKVRRFAYADRSGD